MMKTPCQFFIFAFLLFESSGHCQPSPARDREGVPVEWREPKFAEPRNLLGPDRTTIPGARIQKDADTGRIANLFEGKIVIPGASSQRERATKFLRQYHNEFGLTEDLSELEFLEEKHVIGNDFYAKFRQTHKGIPVLGGSLVVHINGDKIRMVSNSTVPINPEPHATVRTDAEAARKAAVSILTETLHPKKILGPFSADPYVLVENRVARPIWVVDAGTDGPFDGWKMWLDAGTLKAIRVFSTTVRN